MAEFGFASTFPTTITTAAQAAATTVTSAVSSAQTALAGTIGQQNAQLTPQTDIRVRLSPLNPSAVYNSTSQAVPNFPAGITVTGTNVANLANQLSASTTSTPLWQALQQTNGMLFPYTPQISFTQSVNYADLQLVHSNTDYAAYVRTPSVSISISGKFTVQNQAEGIYSLACLHFLRTVSKSYFGANDPNAGLPPPILVLNGYGNYIFNNLAVIVKSHNWSFDDSADGIDIVFGNNRARLPALFTISCELMAIQTPQRMRQKFTFSGFASGQLMQVSSTPGWI